MDFDGRLRSVSSSHEPLLGYKVAELLGFSYLELLHPDDSSVLDSAIDALVTGAETAEFEARVRCRSGLMRWLRFTIYLRGEDACIHSVGRDVTDQKSLEQSVARAAAIIEASDDAILSKDTEGIITSWNAGAERLYGYSPAEMIGQPVSRIVPANRVGEERGITRKIMSGARMDHYETERVRKDGTLVDVSLTASPVRDSSGRVVEASAIAHDITERKQVERRLADAAADLQRRSIDLERSNTELEQFAYAVSHDLSEPLRMVSSYLQLLSRRYEGKLDQDADEFIAFAVDGAMRMHDLIEGLLLYSRAGTAEYALAPVDSGQVVRDTLATMQGAVRDSGADIEVEDLPTVSGDEAQLSRIFQNLIANAIKFTDGEQPRVRVSARRDGADWRFVVSDNGIGIDPGHAERVFVVFQRLNERERYPGSGIGLALCKRIVQRQGGRIWVEPRSGGGSNFYFTLPAVV
jgi:PAS domain S-box-containing protein